MRATAGVLHREDVDRLSLQIDRIIEVLSNPFEVQPPNAGELGIAQLDTDDVCMLLESFDSVGHVALDCIGRLCSVLAPPIHCSIVLSGRTDRKFDAKN